MESSKSNTKDTNPTDAISVDKLQNWLCSPLAHAHWSHAQYVGACKYGAWNWRAAGARASVYINAIKSHLSKFENGEDFDKEDLQHHLGAIMASCAILIDCQELGNLVDDRSPPVPLQEARDIIEYKMKITKEKYKDKNPIHYSITKK